MQGVRLAFTLSTLRNTFNKKYSFSLQFYVFETFPSRRFTFDFFAEPRVTVWDQEVHQVGLWVRSIRMRSRV